MAKRATYRVLTNGSRLDTNNRAAAALDLTHACGERGPRTFNARRRVASALDGAAGKLNIEDVRWLERGAAQPAR